MSDISKDLENIENARYGKDARQSIHDGIEQCHNDVNNPNLTTEALQRAVQKKIDDNTIQNIGLENGSVTQAKLSPALSAQLAAMENQYSQISMVPKDGSVSTPKIVDGAVTREKLDPAIQLKVSEGITDSLTNVLNEAKFNSSNSDVYMRRLKAAIGMQDIHVQKTMDIECANWKNLESVTDTVTGHVFNVETDSNGNKSLKAYASYYNDTTKDGESFTVFAFFDKSIRSLVRFPCYRNDMPRGIRTDVGEKNSFTMIDTQAGGNDNYYNINAKDVDEWRRDYTQIHENVMFQIVKYGPDTGITTYMNGVQTYKTLYAPNRYNNWNRNKRSACLFFSEYGSYFDDNILRVLVFEGCDMTEKQMQTIGEYYLSETGPNALYVPSGIALQPGDRFNMLYSRVMPKGFKVDWDLNSDVTKQIGPHSFIAAKKGEGTLTAKTMDGLTKQVPVKVGEQIYDASTINVKDRDMAEIVITNPPTTMKVGEEWALEAIGLNASGIKYEWYTDQNPINFTSDNDYVATVKFGVVSALHPGTATITASNMTDTVKKSYILKVEPDYHWWENISEDKTYAPDSIEASFEGIQAAINKAIEGKYRKLLFPKGVILDITPADTPVSLPSDLCIDFNGATLRMAKDNDKVKNRKAYTFLNATKQSNLILMNGIFYGENVYEWTPSKRYKYHNEHELLLSLTACTRCRVINCEFSYGPGFTVSIESEWKGGTRVALKPGNIEAGGINDDGTNNDAAENTWRSKDYVSLSALIPEERFMIGCFQGNGGYSLRSRLLSLWFYDKDHTLIKVIKYARQYMTYDLPKGAAYLKFECYQEAQPTYADGDFGGTAHLISQPTSFGVRVEKCTFKEDVSTAILPWGDMTIMDGCYTDGCGMIDPASVIDWEDGGQGVHSSIVRNCTFDGGGSFKASRSSGLTMHDNIFNQQGISIGRESENTRLYHNICNCAVGFDNKYSAILAGNVLAKPVGTFTSDSQNGQIFVADNDVLIAPDNNLSYATDLNFDMNETY